MNYKVPFWLKKITTPGFRKLVRETLHSLLSSNEQKLEDEVKASIARMIGRNDPPSYANDGFMTTHYVRFLHDDKFKVSYKNAFVNIPESIQRNANIEWRAHICCWAASRVIHLDGVLLN